MGHPIRGPCRPISGFGSLGSTHFYVLYRFLLQHLFFIPGTSLFFEPDADLRGAIPFLQHIQPPGITERGLDLAQKEVGGHGIAADTLDSDTQFGFSVRLRRVNRFIGLPLFTSGPAPLIPCLLGFFASLIFIPCGGGVDGKQYGLAAGAAISPGSAQDGQPPCGRDSGRPCDLPQPPPDRRRPSRP